VNFFNDLLKFYAYLFHWALSTFLIGMAILAASSHQMLRLDMLPFEQPVLISRISLMSLIGFISIFLALLRIFQIVFPLWSLALLVLFVWGFFFTPYSFKGPIGFGGALLLIVMTIMAFIGSLTVLMPKRRDRW
jgi:hypothetical protein